MYISFRKILWNKWKQLYVSVCFRKDDLDWFLSYSRYFPSKTKDQRWQLPWYHMTSYNAVISSKKNLIWLGSSHCMTNNFIFLAKPKNSELVHPSAQSLCKFRKWLVPDWFKSANPKISRIGRQKRKKHFFFFFTKRTHLVHYFRKWHQKLRFSICFSLNIAKPENSATGPSTAAIRLKIWPLFNTLVRSTKCCLKMSLTQFVGHLLNFTWD